MNKILETKTLDLTVLSATLSGCMPTSYFSMKAHFCKIVACFSLVLLSSLNFLTATNAQTSGSSNTEFTAKLGYHAEFQKNDDNWKLSVKFDGSPKTRIFLMDSPRRVVLELENAKFSLNDAVISIENEMVETLRFGAVTADKSRLVLTLKEPFDIVEKTLAKEEGSDRHSLEFMFKKVSPKEFSAKVDEQQALLGTSGEVVIKGDRVRAGPKKTGIFHVVLDPGHGGIDGGSKGRKTGILEKEITLKISQKIGDLLEKAGPFEVSYTREEDVFVSLRERKKFAQRQNADLMISIHADSLKQLFVRGATIYTLAKKATDALSQEIADSENLADVVAGLAAPDAQDDVTDILADLTLRETSRFSLHFSTLLVERMASEVAMIKNPQRAASFAVLKNAEVPSALVELGYLSNEEDEKLLNDSAWQDKVAVIVASAVKAFFANKQPHGTAKQ